MERIWRVDGAVQQEQILTTKQKDAYRWTMKQNVRSFQSRFYTKKMKQKLTNKNLGGKNFGRLRCLVFQEVFFLFTRDGTNVDPLVPQLPIFDA